MGAAHRHGAVVVDGVKPGDRLWSATPAELQALAAAGDDMRNDLRQSTCVQKIYNKRNWDILMLVLRVQN